MQHDSPRSPRFDFSARYRTGTGLRENAGVEGEPVTGENARKRAVPDRGPRELFPVDKFKDSGAILYLKHDVLGVWLF